MVARDVGTLIVNRKLVDWIVPSADEAEVFPDSTVRAGYALGATR